VTKQVKPESSKFLYAEAKTESDEEAIRYFKEVCSRDGLEMRNELIKLVSQDWVRRHPHPGNPQKMLVQFNGGHEESDGAVLCEVEGCGKEAVWRCDTVFPYGRFKSLCRGHALMFERRGELRGKKRL
jgi:hypothetical protein